MKTISCITLSLVLAMFSAGSVAKPVLDPPVTVTGNTCGEPDRTATFSDATSCTYQDGTDFNNVADINTLFPGDTWASAGELNGSDGTDGFFTVKLNDGSSWGSGDAEGTWAIADSFWIKYAEAVVSMHVGHGGGAPDAWAWEMTPNASSGTWSYTIESGTGGGLSNIKLFGRGIPVTIPEPTTLALFGLGLIGLLGMARRRA